MTREEEPILGEINPGGLLVFDWVVLGVQTGAGAKKPERAWIERILNYPDFQRFNIPLYLKDNLLKIFPDLPSKKEPHVS